jgi:hypothetical protein
MPSNDFKSFYPYKGAVLNSVPFFTFSNLIREVSHNYPDSDIYLIL